MASKSLYVGNLPPITKSPDLALLFSQYGHVVKAEVMIDRETRRSRGFGFVEMADGADAAITATNGAEFKGRKLAVSVAKPREDKPRAGGGNAGRKGRG